MLLTFRFDTASVPGMRGMCLPVAERCYAVLGDIAKARYLHKARTQGGFEFHSDLPELTAERPEQFVAQLAVPSADELAAHVACLCEGFF